MLAQLLRQNGCSQVTIAAPEGLKMELAKSLDAADRYVELSRKDNKPQLEQIKKDNPYGFDIGMCFLNPSGQISVGVCSTKHG
jgi:D-arabinitol dehydrogenase (NADP+)